MGKGKRRGFSSCWCDQTSKINADRIPMRQRRNQYVILILVAQTGEQVGGTYHLKVDQVKSSKTTQTGIIHSASFWASKTKANIWKQ